MSLSLEKNKMKILLLDGSPQTAVNTFKEDGYTNIECIDNGLNEDELAEKIKDVHVVGVRSKTKVTEKAIAVADKLMAIGRFGVGVNNIDLKAAKKKGVAVFNSPFANTRSVAEMVIANIFNLFRGIPEKSMGAHNKKWLKSVKNSYEIRGKNLGIIGYSNIGTQVSIMAESLGMNVYYYDVEDKLPIGNASQVKSLAELLKISDVITLHVPGIKATENLIDEEAFKIMKPGSCVINTSRGTVVNQEALIKALREEKIIGAALDVFIKEPKSKDEPFESPLQEFSNMILTPHVGGNTIEAQANIGVEVAEKLIKYSNNGSSFGSVNFPQVNLPVLNNAHRIINIHENKQGVLAAINEIFAKRQMNINAQYLQTDSELGYVVVDVDTVNDPQILEELKAVPGTIKTRILY